MQIDSGEKRHFPGTVEVFVKGWYPDGSHLLTMDFGGSHELRKMSTLDGTVRKVPGTGDDLIAKISPDGTQIAFTKMPTNTELWIMGAEGEEPHRIFSAAPSSIGDFTWSPNSRRILYMRPAEGTQAYVIESCDRKGGDKVVAEKDNRLTGDGLAWLPDGRVLYTLPEPPPNERSSNIWFTDVDPDTGRARGSPTQITSGLGVTQASFSTSSDGRYLAFLKIRRHNVVQIAEIRHPSGDFGKIQSLTQDDWRKRPVGWSANGQAVFFYSNPQGKWGLFQGDLDGHDVRELISLPDGFVSGRLTPDRESFLFTQKSEPDSPNSPLTLMRVPIGGGPPSVVLSGRVDYECASQADVCVLSEVVNGKQSYAFLDPLHGRGLPIAADQETPMSWSLSPNGKIIAMLPQNGKGRIEFLQTDGKTLAPIEIKDARTLQNVTWAPDGQNLYVSGFVQADFQILHVKLDGQFKSLWKVPLGEGWPYVYNASPDGRHLTYLIQTYENNAALLENF